MVDVSGIAAGSTAMAQQRAAQEAEVNLQRRAMDIAQSHAEQLLEALPEVGSDAPTTSAADPALGRLVDVRA